MELQYILIENSYIFTMILFGAFIGLVSGFLRIFYPNYIIKRILSGKDLPTKDNWIRWAGLFNLIWFGYITLWFLGYVK